MDSQSVDQVAPANGSEVDHVARQRHRRARGRRYRTLGSILLGIAVAAGFGTRWMHELWLYAVAFVAGSLGAWLFRLGKQMSTLTAEELLASDHRAPVLYLRSFRDEDQTASDISGRLATMPSSEEEVLAAVMNEMGPFVAIGRPGEDLPQLGAARTYVGDDEWQHKVEDLLKAAQLVVFRAGSTPGYWWEVERAARMVPAQRLVFLLPFRDAAEFDAQFRKDAEQRLQRKLPPYPARRRFLSGAPSATVQSLLYFDADRTARIEPLRASRFSGDESSHFARALERALDPVARALGVPWTKALTRKYRNSNRIAAAVVLGVLGLVVFAAISMS